MEDPFFQTPRHGRPLALVMEQFPTLNDSFRQGFGCHGDSTCREATRNPPGAIRSSQFKEMLPKIPCYIRKFMLSPFAWLLQQKKSGMPATKKTLIYQYITSGQAAVAN